MAYFNHEIKIYGLSENHKNTETQRFCKVSHTGTCFEDGAAIYAKEIRENIFLLFIILKDIDIENIRGR